jgi:hypothetical protein
VKHLSVITGVRGGVVGWGTATSWKVAGSINDEVDLFKLPNPSSRTKALWSTQILTEMSIRKSSFGVKGGGRLSRENVGASTSHNSVGLHGLLQG